MAYVAIQYPSVAYGPNGAPQPVANAAAAAALPATYTATPTVAAPAMVPTLDPLVTISTADGMASGVVIALAVVTVAGAVPLVVEAGGPIAPPLNG